MASWVIRLTKADKEKTPLLVRVSQKEGGHDLDLDLLATDGDAAYIGKVRQRSLKKLRAKAYDGSDDDWTAILSHLFRCKTGPSLTATQKTSLDVKCSLSGKDPNGTLTISLLNKIEDITQQLGSIELPQTEDTDEIDLFGWAIQVIDKRDELETTTEELQEKAKSKDGVVTALQEQIDELVKVKAEHEQQLLGKFAALLNEKKLKIRNMQRVLSTAQADPSKLKDIQAAKGDAAPSRTRRGTKRRAEPEEQTEESDDFETMDVDNVVNNPDEPVSSESGRSTPSPDPEETASEDEDEGVPQRSRLRSQTGSKESKEKKLPTALPPRRELPFPSQATDKGRGVTDKAEKAAEPAAPGDDEEEETASEDDEL